MYYALPPKGDERNKWAAIWEPIAYYNEKNEPFYYVFYPHWFEKEFSKDMQKSQF
jgi:hypothetical protein